MGGFAPDARCLDGHFPGNPLVPGAAILATCLACLRGEGIRVTAIERMKFLRPLRPGTPFDVVLRRGPGHAQIDCLDSDGPIATARITVCDTDA